MYYQKNDYITTYKYHHKGTPGPKSELVSMPPQANLLKGPYQYYLTLPNTTETLSDPYEDAQEFLNRTIERKPSLVSQIRPPIVYDTISHCCKTDYNTNHTVYHTDYCKLEDLVNYGKASLYTPITDLPDVWDIPATTQKCSYRDPYRLIKFDQKKCIPSKDDSFKMSDAVMKILNIKTGESEYMGVISNLGNTIIDDAFHGEITYERDSDILRRRQQELADAAAKKAKKNKVKK